MDIWIVSFESSSIFGLIVVLNNFIDEVSYNPASADTSKDD